MVEYFNLTRLGEADGMIGIWRTVSVLSKYYFGLFLIVIVFLIPLITMLNRGEEVNKAFNISSFYTLIFAFLLFLAQIVTSTVYVLIPGLIYATTLGIRWYNRY